MCRFDGDEKEFEALYREHRVAVYGTAFAHLRRHADIDDVVQETFLAAFLQYGSIRNRDNIGSWLCGTARNLALKKLRDTRFHLSLEEIEGLACGSVERDYIRRETNAEIRLAISSLSGSAAETVSLHYLAGKSVKEIAVLMGVPEGTVKSRLHDGRKALRGDLAHRLQMEGKTMEKKNITAEAAKLLELAREAGRNEESSAAITYCDRAIEQLSDTPENYAALAKVYQYRAYANMEDRKTAREDSEKSVAYARLSGDKRLLAECMLSLDFDTDRADHFRDTYDIAAEAGHTAVMAEAACWEGINRIPEGKTALARERFHDAIRCHSQLSPTDHADCCVGDSIRVRAQATAALEAMDMLPDEVLDSREYAVLNLFCQLIRCGDGGIAGDNNYGWDIPGTQAFPKHIHRFISPYENFSPLWSPELEEKDTIVREKYYWVDGLVNCTYEVLDRSASVTTPAGVYADCVHVRVTESMPDYDPEKQTHREVMEYLTVTEYWLAPGAGLVRIHTAYPNHPDAGGRMDLLSCQVLPDPDPAHRFFPLTEGSVWEYAVYDHEGRPMAETTDYRARCRVDTCTEDMAYLAWSGYVREKR